MGALCVKMSQESLVLALTQIEFALCEKRARCEAAVKAAEEKVARAQRELQEHKAEYDEVVSELNGIIHDKRGQIDILRPNGINGPSLSGAGTTESRIMFMDDE